MILAFGTYDAARHPRVETIIDGLRSHGEHVEECNVPLGFSTADRVRMLKQPWRLPTLAIRLVSCWIRLVLASTKMRRSTPPTSILVGYMGHFDVLLARLLFPRTPIVLDHLISASGTAQDRGTGAGLRTKVLSLLDRAATRCANVVVVDTEEHRALLPDSGKGIAIPVGAGRAWLDARLNTPRRTQNGTLRVVFYGLFTPLQGAATMAAGIRDAVARGASLDVTIVGSGQDHAEAYAILAGTPGVSWLDWVEPAQLPALVAENDVCLGIFGDTPKALRVVPNKVYQGLAAGCVVVTSDTAPQRRMVGDFVELVDPADPEALGSRLVMLASSPAYLAAAAAKAALGSNRFGSSAVVEPLRSLLVDLRTTRGSR